MLVLLILLLDSAVHNLLLVELVHRAFNWKNLILQVAVALNSLLRNHTRMLGAYQAFFFKAVNIFHHSVPAHFKSIADCFERGIARISFAVFHPHQITVQRDFSGAQIHIEDFVGEREVISDSRRRFVNKEFAESFDKITCRHCRSPT